MKSKPIKAYKNGKKQLLGMIIGELMKESKGKVNPQEAKKLFASKLDEK